MKYGPFLAIFVFEWRAAVCECKDCEIIIQNKREDIKIIELLSKTHI